MINFDETGARVNARLRWVHVACTPALTSYHLDARRGQAAIDQHAVLPAMTGRIAMHDGWLPYRKRCYDHIEHALCNAHHLRELTGWAETSPEHHAWATPLIALLREGHTRVRDASTAGHHRLPDTVLNNLHHRWQHAITTAYTPNPPPGGQGRGPVLALIDRLRGFHTEIWRFAHDFARPVRQQPSRTRHPHGQTPTQNLRRLAHHHRRRSLAPRPRPTSPPCRKNGINTLDALHDALTGNAWLPHPTRVTLDTE